MVGSNNGGLSPMEGGRFDFEDGGSYIGEWDGGRAHGHGVATGPENQGEFSGQWTVGFESCGVYVWPSGNVYAGSWLKGKRHGEGVQIKGRWVYKGSFTTGFCGRYGVKESLTSPCKYEGSWHLNQFDGFGIETNSDGSTYAGAWSKGVRQGLGVRVSVPYGLAADFRDAKAVRASQSENSITSATNEAERAYRDGSRDPRRLDDARNGFVLRGKSEPPASSRKGLFSKKLSFKKGGLFSKLRKQKSTGDLTNTSQRLGRGGGSLRSNASTTSQMTNHSLNFESMSMAGEGSEEIINPSITETYAGQWNEDKRSGYGVAERSDGLRYEGEWFNNMKDGYGVTFFMDGTKEEGRYKSNSLVTGINKRNKLLMLRNSRLREYVDEAVRKAQEAARDAHEKAVDTANQRAQTARSAAANADERAQDARDYSSKARYIARDFAPDFYQPGVEWERNRSLGEHSRHANAGDDTSIYNNSIYSHTTIYTPPSLIPGSPPGINNHNIYSNNSLDAPSVCLEVSGGSRRGSFRSSFRRNNNATESNNVSSETPNNNTMQNNNINSQQSNNMAVMANAARKAQGRPEIYPQRQPQQNSAPPQHYGPGVSADPQMVDDRYDQYSYYSVPLSQISPPPYPGASTAVGARSKRDSGLGRESSLDEPGHSTSGRTGESDTPDSGMSDTSQLSKNSNPRRRTLPAIMSNAPNKTSPGQSMQHPVDDIIHSVEDLNAGLDASTFIIENGIRKRVQAETQRNKQVNRRDVGRSGGGGRGQDGIPRSYGTKNQAPLSKDLGDGSLPDVSNNQREKLISRDEAKLLSMRRREELLQLGDRRKRGEIIIQVGDVKEFIKNNAVVILVMVVNLGLAMLFLFLLTTNQPAAS